MEFIPSVPPSFCEEISHSIYPAYQRFLRNLAALCGLLFVLFLTLVNANAEPVVKTGTLTATDVDGDALTFSIVSQGAKGTVTINNPATGAFTYTSNGVATGADSFTFKASDGSLDSNVATVTLTIPEPTNTAPTISAIAAQTINEDGSTGAIGFTVGDAQMLGALTVSATSSNTTLVPLANVILGGSGASRTVAVTPVVTLYGSSTITLTVSDGALSATSNFVVTVNSVNDAPSFVKGGNQTVTAGAAVQTVVGWATALSVGPANEIGQAFNFIVSNSNNALFETQPAIATNGTLSYKPATNANGSATVTVQIRDNGGTANGGIDTSAAQTFTITASPAPDTAPTITTIVAQTINEDGATGALSFTVGDTETPNALTVTAASSNATLVPLANIALNGGGASRTVAVTPVANLSGSATITLTVSDGTLNATSNFVVTVNSVNDAPSFVKGGNQTVMAATVQTVAGWATALSAGPANEASQVLNFIVSNSNTALFAAQPTIAANGTLNYWPATNANGSATVTVQIRDNGGTANGGIDTSAAQTFTITASMSAPQITSAATAAGTKGRAFEYQIAAGNSPTSFAASGLPNGLILNAGTGLISGTPTAAGNVSVTLGATNAGGTDSKILLLTIEEVSVSATLTVSMAPANGGTVTQGFSGSTTRTIGESYTITAIPSPGFVFASWSGSGTGNSPTLTFTMADGFDLQASFAPDPLLAARGEFNGLAMGDVPVTGTTGSVKIVVGLGGKFTGKVILAGVQFPISGAFGGDGPATFGDAKHSTRILLRSGSAPLELALSLDISGGGHRITGTIRDGGNVVSTIEADHALFTDAKNPVSPRRNVPVELAGLYTFIFPSVVADGVVTPKGNGWGRVLVTPNGSVRIAGTLADGAAFGCSTVLAQDGTLPLYVPLYQYAGAIGGRVSLVSEAGNDVSGNVVWFRPATPGRAFYPAGWNDGINLNLLGSHFVPGVGRGAAPTSVFVNLSGGNLESELTAPAFLSSTRVTLESLLNIRGFSLAVDPATGMFSGRFLHPVSKSVENFRGVVLQQQNSAGGFFIGTTESGSIEVVQPGMTN